MLNDETEGQTNKSGSDNSGKSDGSFETLGGEGAEKGGQKGEEKNPSSESTEIPAEIKNMSKEDLEKSLHNLQKLQGKQAQELGDAKKKLQSAESITSFLFEDSSEKKPDEKKVEPAKVEPASEVKNNGVFNSVQEINVQFSRDIAEKGVEEATKLSNQRLFDFNARFFQFSIEKVNSTQQAKTVMENFLNESPINRELADNYLKGLPASERKTWRVVLDNNPLFVTEFIKAIKGGSVSTLVDKAKKDGITQKVKTESEVQKGLETPPGSKETPKESKLEKEFAEMESAGII